MWGNKQMSKFYKVISDNRNNMSDIMITRELTDDMKKLVIKVREILRDDNGRPIPKQETPEDVMHDFEMYDDLPDKYAVRTSNYYKIKQVNGKAILTESRALDTEDMFKEGEAVTLSSVQLELIPYSEHKLYGING